MRRALGLPSDQRRIGQAAHDFAQAVGGDGAVLLTRAERNAEGRPCHRVSGCAWRLLPAARCRPTTGCWRWRVRWTSPSA
ncbi:hypothetical protein [Hankyongella ginsenosidimutans]|uniref:hypothetical protein n=1 Tax=Hankyongella ginsenosidimutans TaxID=1763828 RepID=UPI001CA356AB|nr:hypothetical protein [Hankyongella ginsenosidimutans]